ncbi:hypothetical protein CAter282_1631 [Collimonas arenae]|uniref:DUF2867 domain-containing protein n=1 Tax=Collimonas arenae TaxID=279058 RepID=A0A127QHD3_9BURK|nr:hypothetical protein CAter282_1631 [Collimonas arenae]
MPGHDFADAYQVATSISGLDARQAADAIIKHPPSWIKGLMTIRNRVVKLFRLRTVEMGVDDPKSALRMVGGFPIVSQSSQEVILGFDDKHLDFRISIVAAPDRFGGTQVTVATLVKTNNFLGRTYLATILPFHRIIVRHLLERASFERLA